MELKGKVAVVTGSGRGAGRSIALALAREGVRLVLVARTESELSAVCEEAKLLGGEVIAIRTDLSDPEQIKRLEQKTLSEMGTVDILINNAGWSPPLALVQDTTIEDWDYVMNVDARGPFLVTKAFLPTLLAKRSGHIVNVATLSTEGVARASAYCAAKAALVAFGESLLAEVAPMGIRVTNVMAGTMNTEMRWNTDQDFPRDSVIEPEDLAQAIVGILKLNHYVLVREIPVHALVEEDH